MVQCWIYMGVERNSGIDLVVRWSILRGAQSCGSHGMCVQKELFIHDGWSE